MSFGEKNMFHTLHFHTTYVKYQDITNMFKVKMYHVAYATFSH